MLLIWLENFAYFSFYEANFSIILLIIFIEWKQRTLHHIIVLLNWTLIGSFLNIKFKISVGKFAERNLCNIQHDR